MDGVCFVGGSYGVLAASGKRALSGRARSAAAGGAPSRRVRCARAPDAQKDGARAAARATICMAASGSAAQGDKQEPAAPSKLVVGGFFALWYFFNVIFNIVNKKALNMWSYPWTLSTVQLGVGALYCSLAWIVGLRKPPKVSWGLLKALILPSFGHTLGHVMSCISFSLVAISFTHIVKSAEPVVGAMAAALFLGETYPLPVYLTLIPICLGVAMSSASELTFTMAGFATAMASNFAFAMRNVFSKVSMKDYKSELTPANQYGLISIMSFLMELPFCLFFDKGIPKLTSTAKVPVPDQTVLKYLLACSLLYHLYNEVSYSALDNVSPITFSVGNTIKRVIIILTSIIVFKTKILPLNAVGSAVAVLGTFLYSYSKQIYVK
ncbi:Xylulose 5-phosphate/phosphate translocator, chloroplastic [Porphyridium purpureum]|uniref:Xylulose 5-phosphate/phosphate translocator, chloroplastic n=1 Tax=Porphyridium purpureum TaxID=35688 RepID=A0A5J4YVY5_PORPP|nr:Xylulose 5-phosphate/phosphate translocator, chloroplastic [Porphyridium purpureum]|eukprot:POR8891..scf227_4